MEDGSVVYIAGGLTSTLATVGGVSTMDPTTGHITSVGSLPHAVHDATGAMIGGKLFIFAGGSGSGTDAVQVFDPATGRGEVVGHLPVALSDLASATVGSTTYLIGGFDGIRPRPEIYATTDGIAFRTVARLPVGLRYPAVTVTDGEIVIAGGRSVVGPTAAIFAFDPSGGVVRTLGHLHAPIAHAAAFTLGSRVYVVGGRDAADVAVSSVSAVNPAKGTVRELPPLDGPVADAAVAGTSDGALLIGGWGTSTLDQVLRATLRPVAGSSMRPSPER